MGRQKGLDEMMNSFIKSVKETFEKKERLEDEFPYIEGKTVYKEETSAKTYIIAKHITPSVKEADLHNIRIIHVNKENKKSMILRNDYIRSNSKNKDSIATDVENASIRRVKRVINIFNFGYHNGGVLK